MFTYRAYVSTILDIEFRSSTVVKMLASDVFFCIAQKKWMTSVSCVSQRVGCVRELKQEGETDI